MADDEELQWVVSGADAVGAADMEMPALPSPGPAGPARCGSVPVLGLSADDDDDDDDEGGSSAGGGEGSSGAAGRSSSDPLGHRSRSVSTPSVPDGIEMRWNKPDIPDDIYKAMLAMGSGGGASGEGGGEAAAPVPVKKGSMIGGSGSTRRLKRKSGALKLSLPGSSSKGSDSSSPPHSPGSGGSRSARLPRSARNLRQRLAQGNLTSLAKVKGLKFHGEACEEYKQEHFGTAKQLFDKAIECDPSLYQAYTMRASIHLKNQDQDLALEDALKSIEIEPEWASAYNIAGLVYLHKKNFAEALENFNKAAAIWKKDNERFAKYLEVLTSRAVCHKELKNLELALEDNLQVLAANPISKECNYNTGTVYDAMGRHGEAIQHFSQALRQDKKFIHARIGRAVVYSKLGSSQECIEDMTKAIEQDQRKPYFLYLRAKEFRKIGDMEAALQDLDRSLVLNPGYTRSLVMRIQIQTKIGRYAESIRDCNSLLEANPQDADAHYLMGEVYVEQGDLAKCCECLERAVECNPGRADFRRALEVTQAKLQAQSG